MSSRRRRSERRARKPKGKGTPDMNSLQGISPKAMQKALGQIDTNEIENVTEVIVRTTEEEIVLKNPEVTIMNMGQEIWNIVPQSVVKRPLGSSSTEPTPAQEVEVKDSDVQLIVSTAGVSKEEAIAAIKKNGGDIAKAIMSLK